MTLNHAKKIDSTELLNRTELQIHIFPANKGNPQTEQLGILFPKY
jgi:hypothetical protein